MKKLATITFASFAFFSCERVDFPEANQIIELDCIDANCQELTVPGDPYQVNPDFFGYADPSIRKDVNSTTLWLAYSYPHYKLSGADYVPSVSIHLAKSVDSGNNWIFVKELFQPTPLTNPADANQEGFLDHEVVNLLPVKQDNQNYWLAARLNYFIPTEGGFSARPNNSFFISILKADSPENLTNGEMGTIGGPLTHSGWNVNQTLIPPDLNSDAFFWNEPALYFDEISNKLYLLMVAFVYNGPTPVMNKNNTYVYATTPSGNPSIWNWEYKGILANSSVANELGAERISQVDIAKGKDGELLLILSPDDWNSDKNDFNHKGCKVVEIESLENPSLTRDGSGKLKVHVSITASDSNELGSGASAYDPASETGILFTKRIKTQSSLTANIRITGIRP